MPRKSLSPTVLRALFDVSRETTFERDLDPKRDRDALSQILLDLCERLSGDLKRKGYRGKTIGMKLRYADFHTATRDTNLRTAVDDAQSIRDAVRSCLKRVPLNARLRLLEVRAESFRLHHDDTGVLRRRRAALVAFA